MKNIQHLSENQQYIITRVIEQLGDDERFEDIRDHGAAGGFNGFIYYTETVKFFNDNKIEILEFISNEYEFDYLLNELNRIIYNNKINLEILYYLLSDNNNEPNKYEDSIQNIKNYLSWFVLEMVANIYCDL